MRERLALYRRGGAVSSSRQSDSALSAQSLTYTSGQPVSPAFEGWEEDKDGTRYFVFGYMNKNWEEELGVPVGPDNSFSPGDADRGQPTHFLPRRNRFVLRVRVPQGFSDKDELVWTLTTHGRTTKAYASLLYGLHGRRCRHGVRNRRAGRRNEQSHCALEQTSDCQHRGAGASHGAHR